MSVQFIEYARFENNCIWSSNSFSRRENCEPFCFSCNLSSFISKFQRLHIWALCNFFGQEDHRPTKSECARTPMAEHDAVMNDSVFCCGEGNGANCESRMDLKCDPNCHTTHQQIEREKSHTQLSQTLDLRGEKILL